MLSVFFEAAVLESFLATFFMSLSLAMIGTLCVVKKKSLLGEMMSHAALPGVAIAYVLFGAISTSYEGFFTLILMALAFVFCLLAQKLSEKMIQSGLSEDATLCLLLSSGLGIGILIQSFLQKSHPLWFKKSQLFFYGQAATLVWSHVVIYSVLSSVVFCFILSFHQRLKWFLFDREFFITEKKQTFYLDLAIDFLIGIAIVIGIRTAGVILVSGMLIIPVATARRWSSTLLGIYLFSTFFAAISAILGNYLSFVIPSMIETKTQKLLSIPLGPMMIIIAFGFLMLSAIFSFKNGLIVLYYKQLKGIIKIHEENALKRIWRAKDKKDFSFNELKKIFNHLFLFGLFFAKGFIKRKNKRFILTKKGLNHAAYIVRIHRLFELYLSKELNVDLKNVHGIAEELEHVISPEIEKELALILKNPQKDPHHQPIPKEKGIL